MDAEHEAHLRRILEGRRARGVFDRAPETPKMPISTQPTDDTPLPSRGASTSAAPSPRAAASNFLDRVGELTRQRPPSSGGLAHRAYASSADVDVPPRDTTSSTPVPEPPPAHPIFRKDVFRNFRTNPLIVTPTIRPYRADKRQLVADDQRAALQLEAEVRETAEDAFRKPLTQANPFRDQSFECYVFSGGDDADAHLVGGGVAPDEVSHEVTTAQIKNGTLPVVQPYEFCAAAIHTRDRTASNINPAAAIDHLMRGDWFIKSTRHQDAAHHRYFWLGGSGMLFWAKVPHNTPYLASSINIEDIVDVVPSMAADPVTGRPVHILSIWCTSQRVIQIGTEQPAKFDIWFAGLLVASKAAREHNQAFYSRHSTMKAAKRSGMPRIPVASASD